MANEFKFVIKGVQDLENSMLKMTERMVKASELVVKQGGEAIKRNAVKEFLGSPTRKGPNGRGKGEQGKTYANGRSQSWPRPTNRTGALSKSIEVVTSRLDSGTYQSLTGPTVKYGRRVELGGVSRSRANGSNPLASPYVVTRPFPFMAPGFEKSKSELRAIYRKVWTEAING